MAEIGLLGERIDKAAFKVVLDFDESDERRYWLSKTPAERLQHTELLRRMNYGPAASARLQRILEVVEQSSS
jgi:hypothetical protein